MVQLKPQVLAYLLTNPGCHPGLEGKKCRGRGMNCQAGVATGAGIAKLKQEGSGVEKN